MATDPYACVNTTDYNHPRDPNLNDLHNVLEYNDLGQPVLRVSTGGGGMDLTALSVTTIAADSGGSLAYDNTSGVFTFAPADLAGLSLGNFVINGPNLQTLSGTVLGANIVINPNGGAVQVPSLKIGTGGNIVNTNLYIEAYITTYELTSIVAHSNTETLATGTYGNINGVQPPWTVFELAIGVNGTPISAIEIDDILTGVGIIPSVVEDRGAGIYSNYVIVNLDLEGLGQVLPIPGAVFNLTRPLEKATLNIQSATNTDIFLDSQGQGDVIVNTSILPLTTNISSLGSPSKRWKSVYVGPGTIYVLDETLGNDIAIGARDGILYIQNGAGLSVGEWLLQDNYISIADATRDVYIGETSDTGNLISNRSFQIKDSGARLAYETDRTGRTQFYPPAIPANDIGGVSIIGSPAGNYHPVTSPGGMLHITGNDGTSNRLSMDAFGAGGNQSFNGLIARAGRGTSANPTQLLAGDIILRLTATGWRSDTGFAGVAAGGASTTLDFVSLEATSDATRGSAHAFYNAPLGNNTRTFSGLFNATGLSFVKQTGDTDLVDIGITFKNGDRLTYFPTPVSQTNYYLKSNGTTMSWQPLPVTENPIVYKGSWNASTNSPLLRADPLSPVGAVTGWEYSIEATSTIDIGSGSTTYEQGGFVIFNGTTWDYIPPNGGVSSIQFDSGVVRSGVVQVVSSDITSTLDSGSIANVKLANSSITVTAGTGLSGGGTVSLGQSITLTNAGITSIVAGTGISVSGSNGTKTISNTGVLSVTGTNHISASVVSGAVTVTSDATSSATNNTIALRDSIGGLEAKDYTATKDVSALSDHGAFNYGTLTYLDNGIIGNFTSNIDAYNQFVMQNRNSGQNASTNFIVSNDLSTLNTYYGEFGINSSGYVGGAPLAEPNAVYVNSVSSGLVLGGNHIHFVVNSDDTTDAIFLDETGVATFTNQIVGSISGSANNVRQSVTFAATGGAAPGSTFNGSNALTVNYSTVGAQAPLSSGVNIKTVNGNNLLGTGNVAVGTVTSVSATGTVSGLTLSTGGSPITTTGTITLGGTITGLTNSNLNGTAGITNANLANSTISGVSLGSNLYQLKPGTNVSFVGATNYNGSTEVTVNVATGAGYSYTLPVATASVLGGVKQGSNVTIDAGGIISVAAPYTLPTAGVGAGGTLGGVKVDGTTVTISSGIISAVNTAGVGGNQLVYELNASLNLTSAKNTLVSMFGLTSGVALQSNTRYQYEIVFTLSSNKAGTISYALALSGGAVVAQHNFQWMANKTANIDGYAAGIAMASFNATGAAITTAKDIAAFDNFTHVVIYGNIDVTTAGNVNFMLSQDQNTPIVWTMLPGAYVRLLPIGAIGANTAAGTWS